MTTRAPMHHSPIFELSHKENWMTSTINLYVITRQPKDLIYSFWMHSNRSSPISSALHSLLLQIWTVWPGLISPDRTQVSSCFKTRRPAVASPLYKASEKTVSTAFILFNQVHFNAQIINPEASTTHRQYLCSDCRSQSIPAVPWIQNFFKPFMFNAEEWTPVKGDCSTPPTFSPPINFIFIRSPVQMQK